MTVKNGLLQKLIRTIVTVETFLTGFINVTITFFCKKHFIIIFIIIIIYIIIIIIFIRVFLMDTNNSRDIRGREGTIFYSTVSLSPTQEHSDTYLHLCMWDDLLFLGSFSCHWHFSLASQIYQLWGLPKLLFVAFFFT